MEVLEWWSGLTNKPQMAVGGAVVAFCFCALLAFAILADGVLHTIRVLLRGYPPADADDESIDDDDED